MAKAGAVLRSMLLALCVVMAPNLLAAHEGHDHAATAPPPSVESPRLGLQSDRFELVAFPSGPDLVIYLDDADSNEPVPNAAVTIESAGRQVSGRELAPGVYTARQDWFKQPGKHALTISIAAGDQKEQFSGTLLIASPTAAVAAPKPRDYGGWARGLALAGFGFGAALLFRSGRERWAGAVLALVMVLVLAASAFGQSSPQSAKPITISAPVIGDAVPHRHPDGSVFLPKATQHILGIRTERALESETARVHEIPGRVIADPNKSGRVQAARDGRIEPAPQGLPYLGQSVKRDEALAYLIPILSSFEESSLRQTLAQIERDMALLVPRADALGVVNPNMPAGDTTVHMMQELQIQSQALTRQKEAVLATLNQKIEIKSPVAGSVTGVNIVAGQVVAARDTLFEVADPSAAWVEAWSFDPVAVEQIAGATAIAEPGRELRLAFIGRGRVLQQQAVPLLFRVEQGAEKVSIGEAVRVVLAVNDKQIGIVLPAAALTRGPGNLPVVFEHTAPETFVPRIVQVVALDAARVVVFGAVSQGMRLVTSGAGLIAQVR
jgi:cobalt-zinc-cadmium efflux system membrane fusion protein